MGSNISGPSITTNSLITYNLTLKIKSNSAHGWHKSDQLHQLLSFADGSLEDSPLVDLPGGDDELNSRRNRMCHAIGIEVGTFYSA